MANPASEQTKIVGWARVYPALQRTFSKALRRGAWYPVVRDELPDRVSIRLGSRIAVVPRRIVEIRRDRPRHFTVVQLMPREVSSGDAAGPNLGLRYGVCPACAYRLRLIPHAQRATCPGCKHEGEVGWWEV